MNISTDTLRCDKMVDGVAFCSGAISYQNKPKYIEARIPIPCSIHDVTGRLVIVKHDSHCYHTMLMNAEFAGLA